MPRAYALRRRFLAFNQRYFDGRLPRATALRWNNDPNLMGATMLSPPIILINQGLARWPKAADMTLLHEMCHLSTAYLGHGPRFQREMLRLAKDGAFNSIW